MVQFKDLKIGKQTGFEIKVGWVHILYVRLKKKFRFEFHIHNGS